MPRMRTTYPFILSATLVGHLAIAGTSLGDAVSDDPDLSDADAIEEIRVDGEYPGPGVWKVMRAGDPDNHILWIVLEPPPLPEKMKWKSNEIEAVARDADEILLPSAVDVEPTGKIGFFKGLSLVPAALGVRKNPDKAKLQDVVPADLYAHWLLLKPKYLGGSRGIERWRPLFAAQRLEEKAFAKAGFSDAQIVREVLSELAEEQAIQVTAPKLRFTFDLDEIKPRLKEFSRERLDDLECFATTLELVDAVSDTDTMHARASAWASGDLTALAALPGLPEPSHACGLALLESNVAKDIVPSDVAARLDALWLEEAEQSLADNRSTLAVLHFSQLARADSYFVQLREKGYVVESPRNEDR
jgi:hypothetical protein